MDQTDYKILNILQQDCRVTLRVIGEQVSLTPPAVAERIHKMEEENIIRGYRACIDRMALECSMAGFIFVAVEPEKYLAFCEFCKNNSTIIEHYHVIGVYNALLRFAVRGTRELDQLLTSIKAFGDSRTSVELKTYFDTKEILPMQHSL